MLTNVDGFSKHGASLRFEYDTFDQGLSKDLLAGLRSPTKPNTTYAMLPAM
jgi:hypothetical protein